MSPTGDEDSQARVAVFHGANGQFCAGWDLQFGARMAQRPDGARSPAGWNSPSGATCG
jgi:enoyl-CoA hydratase/carnithine racemase